MTKPVNILPFDVVKALFDYDKETGLFTWKIPFGINEAGDPAGYQMANISGKAYLWISFGRRWYAIHNLIWMWVTGSAPTEEIDHQDRNPMNNRWQNLREGTRSQNQANTALYKSNTSGCRGVHFHPRSKRWRAMIAHGGKSKHLGYFVFKEDAENAWKQAAKEKHGEFANT